MSDDHPFGEELQDLLDGRLAQPRRGEIEGHVAQCPRCRQELGELERGRAAARGLPQLAQPVHLSGQIARALDAEDRRWLPRRWLAVAAGLIAVASLVTLLIRSSAPGNLPAAVARDFAAYRDARLPLELQTGDPAALERFFAQRRIAFPTRVFDFGMMEYRLAGGRVHRLAGRPTALFAYVGGDGRRLVCQMYQGTLAELPGEAEQRVHAGITFWIYRVSGTTLVFWQEGAVVCVLASEGNTEEVVQLAYAKAVKV